MRKKKNQSLNQSSFEEMLLIEAEEFVSREKEESIVPILHEVEIVYKSPLAGGGFKILCSKDAYEIFKQIFDSRKIDLKEMFYVLLLNRAYYCLCYSLISTGTISAIVVNVKEIFQLAIKANASAVIVAHNHPSGSLKPSERDITLTKQLKQGCHLLDLELLDHLILSKEGYLSVADEGLI